MNSFVAHYTELKYFYRHKNRTASLMSVLCLSCIKSLIKDLLFAYHSIGRAAWDNVKEVRATGNKGTCWNSVHPGRLRSQQAADNWKAPIARQAAARCIADSTSPGFPALEPVVWMVICVCVPEELNKGEILPVCSPQFPSLPLFWRHRPAAM